MSLFERHHRRLPEAREASSARLLTSSELLRNAQQQFLVQLEAGLMEHSALQQFVEKKVKGVKVNGINVITIDIDDRDHFTPLSPITKAYMGADATKVNVIEYFDPELRKNKVHTYMNPRASWRKRRRPLEEQDPEESIFRQLYFAKEVTEAAKDTGKPVAVMDIADRVSFFPATIAMRSVPNMVNAGLALADIVPSNLGTIALASSWFALLGYQMIENKGMYNRDQVTVFDKFVLDLEQARRLYVGKGIEQVTRDLSESGATQDDQVVALYPRAHGIRILDAIVNPRPVSNKIKSGIYKISAPWLNYETRMWEYKGEGSEDQNGWVRTSKKRITM